MALYSPGVEIKEIDLTNVVPALATSIGGYAGSFNWGPSGQLVTVSYEKDLVTLFGAPKSGTYSISSFFTAASFLKYGNALKISRSVEAGDNNAAAPRFTSPSTYDVVTSATSKQIANQETFEAIVTGDETKSAILARYPGSLGNSLKVVLCRANGLEPAILNRGLGYSTGTKTTTSANGIGCTLAVATVAGDGSITTLTATPVATGTGYIVGDVLTISGGTSLATVKVESISPSATGCTLTISEINASGGIVTAAVTAAGTGYAVGDVLTVSGGTEGKLATVRVATLTTTPSATGVATFSIVTAGEGNVTTGGAKATTAPLRATGPVKTFTFIDATTVRTDATLFSYVPGISTYATDVVTANSTAGTLAANLAKAQDEIHVAIIDSDGSFTGTAGTILERYEGLSLFIDAKTEFGATNYYRSVINNNSSYIYINALSTTRITSGTSGVVESEFAVTGGTALSSLTTQLGAKPATGGVTITLAGGTEVAMTASGVSNALELFSDAESVDVNLLFTEQSTSEADAIANDIALAALVNSRKDCIGFVSAPYSLIAKTSDTLKKAEITSKISTNNYPNSSYIVMDSSALYIYNKYADNYLWIPACGHVAGLCANTDRVADAWFSPAGFNRGQLQDVVKLSYNPNQADRNELYSAGVNPIVSFPGQGIVLYGDKTRLSKPSAFDRINVRRLFITLQKAIANASRFQLFEQNDDFTRAAFKNIVEPFLREVKGRRGITDFRVVCDSTNNTGEVIDGNRFVADIYIKPTRSINFITLNFIATRSGVEFKEIVG